MCSALLCVLSLVSGGERQHLKKVKRRACALLHLITTASAPLSLSRNLRLLSAAPLGPVPRVLVPNMAPATADLSHIFLVFIHIQVAVAFVCMCARVCMSVRACAHLN